MKDPHGSSIAALSALDALASGIHADAADRLSGAPEAAARAPIADDRVILSQQRVAPARVPLNVGKPGEVRAALAIVDQRK